MLPPALTLPWRRSTGKAALEFVLTRERHVRTSTDSERTGTVEVVCKVAVRIGKDEFRTVVGNVDGIAVAERSDIREHKFLAARQINVQVEVLIGSQKHRRPQ